MLHDGQLAKSAATTTTTTTATANDARNPLKYYKRLRNRKHNRTTANQYSMHTTSNNGNSDTNAIINYMDQVQVPAISCNYNGTAASSIATAKSHRDHIDDNSRDMMDNDMDDDMDDEDDGYPGDGDDDDDAQEQQQLEHIFEPMSSENGQTTRPCLAWACKACKKKSVAVDRRKAATLRERRRLRKVGGNLSPYANTATALNDDIVFAQTYR